MAGSSRSGYHLSTEQWVARVLEKRGERYDYSKVVYTDYMAKVTIVCKEHGDFEQSANRHMQGDNCPRCADVARSAAQTNVARMRMARPYRKKEREKVIDFAPLLAAWR